jgi:hypothetical protein
MFQKTNPAFLKSRRSDSFEAGKKPVADQLRNREK